MNIYIKIKKFIRLSFKEQYFFIKAYYFLIIFHFFHPKFVSDILKLEDNKDSLKRVDVENSEKLVIAQNIGSMIQLASYYTPWSSSCLVQSLVAKKILQKEHISARLYIGVKKDNLNVKAHSWVECSGKVILGMYEYQTYKIIAVASWISSESNF